MALINCPECEHEVSSKAQNCPHCGAPILQGLEKDIASVQKVRKWVGYFLMNPILLGSGWLQLIASKLAIELPVYGFGEAKSFSDVLLFTAPLTIGVAVIVLALLRGWLESLYATIVASALVLAATSYICIHFIPWFGLDANLLNLAETYAGLSGVGSYFSLMNVFKFLIFLLFGYWQHFGWWYFVSSFVVGSYVGWWLHKDILIRWLQNEI